MKATTNSIFEIQNPLTIKVLTFLRHSFIYLKKYIFKRNFQNNLDPLCIWEIILNQQHISFSIAQVFQFKEEPQAKSLSIQLCLHST